MVFRPCEYELIPPTHIRPTQETESADASDHVEAVWVHPDVGVTARAITLSRSSWGRRFVFFETLDTQDMRDDRCGVFPLYHGYRNAGDGSVVVVRAGQPYGWYTSIGSGWPRLKRANGLFLAWLELEVAVPDTALTAAELEASRGRAATWYLSVPFTAHGPAEARQRGLDITIQLQPWLPGLDRLDITYRLGGEADTEAHVFCEAPGCLLVPGHAGDHQPQATATTPATDDIDSDSDND